MLINNLTLPLFGGSEKLLEQDLDGIAERT
jgi:hypothetical protein